MVRRTTIFGNVKLKKIKFWDGTSFHYRRAILFCSASARRPEIFLFFCLGHLRWIVEENFIDNFLGHSCCECVASFFFRLRNHVKNPTRHHLGFLFWGNLRYWRSIDTFSTGDLFPNRDPFSIIGILTSSVLKPSSPILN
ncbi:unnamed protein product [Acanthoscelides obtectus]|uniref:Uncharacterized protein n=1 Tax=Acanthoscelides obtectus TaxID=200917 RepID=A0A9P0JGX2_ACAOB|nr:unnamed protein product [Acanthoscelides obtectus]CAK1639742.1 hypothetical protein AOBTE_LOCUS11348 [Acanthoscelides obtectus]